MLKSKYAVAYSVLAASLVLTFALTVGLQSASPMRVAQAATGLVDTTMADFNSGVITDCYIGPSGSDGLDGEIVLSPTVGTDFPGDALPGDWVSSTVGVAAVSNGWLSVNEGGAGTAHYFTPGRVLEFEALFVTTTFQHAGFAINLSSNPNFAIFSTGASGTELMARTQSTATAEVNTPLGSSYFGTPHRYRIEWTAEWVDYFIDGSLVAVHAGEFGASMHPAFQDFNSPVISLTVDWARLSDYSPSTCTFESRVINSGVDSTYQGLTATVATPAGTSIAFEVLTSTDGLTWGPTWTPVNPDGTFTVEPSRYIKYRAALTTTQASFTPEIQSVRLWGLGPTAVRLTSFSAAEPDLGMRGWLIGLGIVALAVGGVSVIFRRRKRVV